MEMGRENKSTHTPAPSFHLLLPHLPLPFKMCTGVQGYCQAPPQPLCSPSLVPETCPTRERPTAKSHAKSPPHLESWQLVTLVAGLLYGSFQWSEWGGRQLKGI